MSRIKSKNPHRTETNRDCFDYMEGKIIVGLIIKNRYYAHTYCYSGNNMAESIEARTMAIHNAKKTHKILAPFFDKAYIFYF